MLKPCTICGKSHRTLTRRQCLLGKRGQRGYLWKTLKKAMQCRDQRVCQRCEKSQCTGEDEHMSHVYRAGRCGYLKYDLQNVKTMCGACHRWWHDYEIESGCWFAAKFPERLAYLKAEILKRRQTPGTIPMSFYLERLDELKKYIDTKSLKTAVQARGL